MVEFRGKVSAGCVLGLGGGATDKQLAELGQRFMASLISLIDSDAYLEKIAELIELVAQ